MPLLMTFVIMSPRLSRVQFARFAGVGAIGTAVHYAVLIALVEVANTPAFTASIAGSLVGALVNYYLAYRYAFQSTAAHASTLPRFAMIAVIAFTLNALGMWVLVEHLSAPYILAQIVTTTGVLFVNYVANALWTFSGDGRDG